jgi:hypothetical protein
MISARHLRSFVVGCGAVAAVAGTACGQASDASSAAHAVARITPTPLRWGRPAVIVYDPSAQGALFRLGDSVFVHLNTGSRDLVATSQELVAAMTRDHGVFRYANPC